MAMGSPASPRNVGAVQPPRAARLLHTRRGPSPLSSYPRYTLLRHPRRGFLSSVSLCLPFPRRAVAPSCAAFARVCMYVHSSRPVRAYIDRILVLSLSLSLSHAALVSPRCTYRALHLEAAVSRAHGGIRRITPCVFLRNRGEPRALNVITLARISGAALIALGVRWRHACRIPRSQTSPYLSPCLLCVARGYEDKTPPRFPPPRIFCTLIKVKGKTAEDVLGDTLYAVFRRKRVQLRRTYGLAPRALARSALCTNFNCGTSREFMRHFAYFARVLPVEFGGDLCSGTRSRRRECTR